MSFWFAAIILVVLTMLVAYRRARRWGVRRTGHEPVMLGFGLLLCIGIARDLLPYIFPNHQEQLLRYLTDMDKFAMMMSVAATVGVLLVMVRINHRGAGHAYLGVRAVTVE